MKKGLVDIHSRKSYPEIDSPITGSKIPIVTVNEGEVITTTIKTQRCWSELRLWIIQLSIPDEFYEMPMFIRVKNNK